MRRYRGHYDVIVMSDGDSIPDAASIFRIKNRPQSSQPTLIEPHIFARLITSFVFEREL